MNLSFPPIVTSCANPTCAMIAPSFPEAAEIPCAVDRYRVGNTSPGIINVVEFGPQFWKKSARQYKNTNAFVAPVPVPVPEPVPELEPELEPGADVSLSYPNPMMTKRTVRMMNP